MSKDTDFLLGFAFGVIDRIRSYLIFKNDTAGLEQIEDPYQTIRKGIDKHFYSKDKSNGD